MKMLKLSAAALALLWAVNVNAADDERTLSVRALQGEKKAVVRVVNLSGEQASVLSIKDPSGRILYKENIKSGNVYAKRYDFSSLPSGVYAIEVAQGQEVTKRTFNLQRGELSFKNELALTQVKSVVDVEPNLVKVLVQNQKSTDVKLRLYDAYGNVLHEESVAPNQTIAKGLNLSKVGAGRYSVAVTGEDYQYVKNITNEVK